MKTRIPLLLIALGTGSAAYAQVPPNPFVDDVMPLTAQLPTPETHVLGGPPAQPMSAARQGPLSRAQVLAELHEARRAGTIPSGEASGYPYTHRRPMTVTAEASPPVDTRVLGGPPAVVPGLSYDGYRFIGGEAGFAPIGSRAYDR